VEKEKGKSKKAKDEVNGQGRKKGGTGYRGPTRCKEISK